ncbi:class I SAM-dependent methyltransferase [Chloroflexota bacterium]
MAIKYDLANELGDGKQREELLYYGITCDDKRAFEIYKSVIEFGDMRNSNVIDVGGARGLNLKYFLGDNNCYVVDYERHELLAGIQYLCETAKDVPESMPAKVVLYCHTLEHVVDPVKEILNIKDILEPGGLLYIEVPFGCWNEYKRTRNFLTHINFFSEGSLYHLLDMCGLAIRYLRLKPTLSRVKYVPVIVAIAQNLPTNNEKIDAYRATRSQIGGKRYYLRARQAFLTAKLLKFKLFLAAYRQYQFRRQIRMPRKDERKVGE